eukprot:360002-Chlamydomonas_euryale.AAC.2
MLPFAGRLFTDGGRAFASPEVHKQYLQAYHRGTCLSSFRPACGYDMTWTCLYHAFMRIRLSAAQSLTSTCRPLTGNWYRHSQSESCAHE